MRLDKWLWAARFYKTRGLAQRAVGAGQVKLNDARVKPAHELKVGDSVFLRKESLQWHVLVKALSERRGPSGQAMQLYQETQSSRTERERRADLRRYGSEPAAGMKGRPTKRNRRRLENLVQAPDE